MKFKCTPGIRCVQQDTGQQKEFELVNSIVKRVESGPECEKTSQRLLDRFGSIQSILCASSREIMLKGDTSARLARELSLAGELVQAVTRIDVTGRPLLDDYKSVIRYCRATLAGERKEHFHALFLDKAFHLLSHECIQTGTVDHVAVYPRELLSVAIQQHASSIILVHNHPSGNPEPSAGDVKMTRQLITAAGYFGISIADHVIVSPGGNFSFRENGLIPGYQENVIGDAIAPNVHSCEPKPQGAVHV